MKRGDFTPDELDDLCHGFKDADFQRLRSHLDDYQSKLFGFTDVARAKRTPEWLEKAAKRYEGQVTTCCECGEDYPLADNALGGEVFCAKCREVEIERMKKRKGQVT